MNHSSTDANSEVTAITKAQKYGIRLVLNGGKETLDNSTIPVEWHFSDELIAKIPRYIVICDHEMPLDDFMKTIRYSFGYRYAFSVKELAGYIQLHRPGRHHFIAIVICGDEENALKETRKLLDTEDRNYIVSISASELENGMMSKTYPNEITAVEFEAPEGLFAQKPKTPFGKFIWSWVNRWYTSEPIDQCKYRKRKILAFTLQPILFLIGRSVAGITLTLWKLAGCSVVFLIGYRPMSILDAVRTSWTWRTKYDIPDGFTKFSFGDYYWRVWKKDKGTGNCTRVPVWAVPASLCVEIFLIVKIAIFLYGSASSVVAAPSSAVPALIIISIICLLTALVIKIRAFVTDEKRMERRRARAAEIGQEKRAKGRARVALAEEQKVIKERQKQDALVTFLKTNSSFHNVPKAVDIKKILPKVDSVTRFRLSFWSTKAKVCKPFPK